jgi:hypothetical protein
MSELGYPGLILFILILVGCQLSCQQTRLRAKRTGRPNVAAYATHLQISFIAFIVAGTFLNAQYLELVWHMVGLSMALERIVETAPATVPDPAPQEKAAKVEVMPRYLPQPARRSLER